MSVSIHWLHGGAYFGVPITNFFGWFLTVCVIYQSFEIFLQRESLTQAHLPTSHWRQAEIFYGSVGGRRSGTFSLFSHRTDIPWRRMRQESGGA